MLVELCTTTDNPKTVNKTFQLNNSINITFRNNVNEQAPDIVMNKDNLAGSNYVHIPNFKRYYFINSIDNYNAKLVILHLTTDLLMTYQDIILNSEVQIVATEKPSYLSASLPTQTTISKRVVNSNVTLDDKNSMVLTTIG